MSKGTSNPVTITGETFSARKNPQFSPVQGINTSVYGETVEVKPPDANADTVSLAFETNQNSFPQFTFEKISEPEYGRIHNAKIPIGHYTGVPVNTPDYVNDYFVISLMRTVDKIVKPVHKGKVNTVYDTPEAKS